MLPSLSVMKSGVAGKAERVWGGFSVSHLQEGVFLLRTRGWLVLNLHFLSTLPKCCNMQKDKLQLPSAK